MKTDKVVVNYIRPDNFTDDAHIKGYVEKETSDHHAQQYVYVTDVLRPDPANLIQAGYRYLVIAWESVSSVPGCDEYQVSVPGERFQSG